MEPSGSFNVISGGQPAFALNYIFHDAHGAGKFGGPWFRRDNLLQLPVLWLCFMASRVCGFATRCRVMKRGAVRPACPLRSGLKSVISPLLEQAGRLSYVIRVNSRQPLRVFEAFEDEADFKPVSRAGLCRCGNNLCHRAGFGNALAPAMIHVDELFSSGGCKRRC